MKKLYLSPVLDIIYLDGNAAICTGSNWDDGTMPENQQTVNDWETI